MEREGDWDWDRGWRKQERRGRNEREHIHIFTCIDATGQKYNYVHFGQLSVHKLYQETT